MKDFSGKTINVEQSSGADFEGVDMSINAKNTGFIFDILFNQMYRDPIGSVIREITSNCFDSHIEAKVDDAVVIEMEEDDGGQFITFTDVGIGISPERMQNIYSKPTESTKRGTNDQIGYWGLGSKSPLAYTDSFELTTVYAGVKYEYIVHKGANAPRIDKILEEPTEDRNGSVVKIYLKSSRDWAYFIEKLSFQLRYFDNVYIEGINFNNDYQIFEGEHFKFRSNINRDTSLHICIGKVTYPIDWDKLGIKEVKLPVGLKFAIGDLPITPERESIRYMTVERDGEDVDTRDIIKAKIDAAIEEIKGMVPADFFEHNNIFEYQEAIGKPIYIKLLNRELNIESLFEKTGSHVYLPLHEKGLRIPEYPFSLYRTELSFGIVEGSKTVRSGNSLRFRDFEDSLIVRLFTPINRHKAVKLDYFRHLAKNAGKSYVCIVAPNSDYKYALSFRSLGIPRVVNYEEGNKLSLWKYFKSVIRKELITNSIDYLTTEVPTEFIRAWQIRNKKHAGIVLDDESIPVENIRIEQKTNRRMAFALSRIEETTGFIVYGFETDLLWLEFYSDLFRSGEFQDSTRYRVFKIRQRDEKHFVPCRNTIYVKSLMSNNPVFIKIATSLIINKSSIWDGRFCSPGSINNFGIGQVQFHKVDMMGLAFTPVVATLDKLDKISRATISVDSINTDERNQFKQEIINIAEQNGWVDKQVHEDIKRCERYLEGLDLLKYVVPEPTALPHIVDFLKLKGKPVNPEWGKLEPWQESLINELAERDAYYLEVYSTGSYRIGGKTYIERSNAETRRKNALEWRNKYKDLYTKLQPILNYQKHGTKERVQPV